jgi:hypothetical protein
MGNTPTLIPKRKLMEAFSSPDGDASTQTLNSINEIITTTASANLPETVARLHVTYRLRIPVGTDMYD